MSQIILDRLDILNFKGIEKQSITFDRASQNIWGANGTGKTTIADAFQWLLFGKNSHGEADFGIKPLKEDGSKKENADTEVTGVIDFNGRKITLKHRFVEVWRKTKGSERATLQGNTHEYFIDNAPYQLAEYKAFISNLVPEEVFPLITNPLHFNRLPWQKGRTILLQMGGDISNADLAAAHPEFKELIDALTNKTLSKYKQEVLANKKLVKEEMDGIPTRIDEVRRGMPEPVDHEAIVAQIASRQEMLDEIDEEIGNATKAGETFTKDLREHQAKVRGLRLDQDGIASKLRSDRKLEDAEAGRELKQKQAALTQKEHDITAAQNSIDNNERRKATIEADMEKGRAAWKVINAETLEVDPNDLRCPTCLRDLPEDKAEEKRAEFKTNFDDDKAGRLKRNLEKGQGLKKELADVVAAIAARTKERDALKGAYDLLVDEIRALEAAPVENKADIETVILSDPKYIEIGKKIAALELEAPKEEKKDLTSQRLNQQGIRAEMDELKKKLTVTEQREQAETRITELKSQETDLARQLDKWERMESLIEKFTKVKIDALTDRINSLFRIVRFKMFNYLQNGGVEETCQATVDGVPYSDLNTASRINAGIDIINVLSEHYGVRAPIVADNRESVTSLMDTSSQVINLFVREDVNQLYVGKNPPERKAHLEALAL